MTNMKSAMGYDYSTFFPGSMFVYDLGLSCPTVCFVIMLVCPTIKYRAKVNNPHF